MNRMKKVRTALNIFLLISIVVCYLVDYNRSQLPLALICLVLSMIGED